jgi:hypothetical protein
MEKRVSETAAFLPLVPLSSLSARLSFAGAGVPLSRPTHYAVTKVTRATLGTPLGPIGGSKNGYNQMVTGAALRSLLTRRAVTTVAYYLTEMNDSATRNWMYRFESFQERDENNKFEDDGTFLHNMLRAKVVACTMTVGHPRGRFRREFKFTINPFNIASRILVVRLQLAEEWSRDLRCIALENKEIERMALERMLMSDEKALDSVRGNVFDYDNLEGNQTPLRYKNYCKLKLYVTQHAISRFEVILRDTSNHDYMFFRTFRRSKEPMMNDEDFIVSLMAQPRVMRMNPSHEIYPKKLAHALMAVRERVAAECIDVLNGIEEEQKLDERRRLEYSLSLAALGEDAESTTVRSEAETESLEDSTPSAIDSTKGV